MISFLSNGTVSGKENVCACEDCNKFIWVDEKMKKEILAKRGGDDIDHNNDDMKRTTMKIKI